MTVTDTLPAGLTATAISGTGWTCTLSTLTCTRTDGFGCWQQLSGDYAEGKRGRQRAWLVTNTAAVTGGGDLNPSNNSASDVTKILLPGPDLAISKSHSGNFAQGQAGAGYTITVSNVGGAASSGTVTVTDALPTGLTATAISGTGWTCTLGTLTCTRSNSLASGGAYPAITLR